MRMILMGAPGSGKGTQAEFLSQRLNVPSISTGNILREAVREGAEVGLRVKMYTDQGLLVPDDIMVDIIRERLSRSDCCKGFILDGFPRTVAQAKALRDLGVQVDAVLSLEVPDEEIERRMSGRRICEDCGASYHVDYRPPKTGAVCDACGGMVRQRDDDAPETVRRRLRVYHESTEPVKGYYESCGLLRTVAAHDGIGVIRARVEALLGIETLSGEDVCCGSSSTEDAHD